MGALGLNFLQLGKKEEPKKVEKKESSSSSSSESDSEDENGNKKTFELRPIHKQQLNQVIGKILREKIKEEELGQKITMLHIMSLVPMCANIFTMVGEEIHNSFPELKSCNRDIFMETIFNEVHKRETEDPTESQKYEIELIRTQELKTKIEEIIYPKTLTQGQQSCLNIILQKRKHNGHVLYSDVLQIMNAMDIKDVRVAKDVNKANALDYDSLDFKSIRLLNRMIHYLGSEAVSFTDFMKDIVKEQTVKTNVQNQKVEVFAAKKFFQKLYDHNIKKTNAIHYNLCLLLCIDPKYKNYLMLKKLKRCIMDFNKIAYFQSIGLKKRREPEEEGDEYYDEEDDGNENGEIKIMNTAAPEEEAEVINAKKQKPVVEDESIQRAPAQPNVNDSYYDYYDEEDDGDTKGGEPSPSPPKIQAQPVSQVVNSLPL